MKPFHMGAFTLVIIGALNWGLVGLFNYNLVAALFGWFPMLEGLIYVLVGASGIFLIATHMQDCMSCDMMPSKNMTSMPAVAPKKAMSKKKKR
jgi:hypothetical protein